MAVKAAMIAVGAEVAAAFVGGGPGAVGGGPASLRTIVGASAAAQRPATFAAILRKSVALRSASDTGNEVVISPFAAGEEVGGGSTEDMEFNVKNVDIVLDSVRPYLIAGEHIHV